MGHIANLERFVPDLKNRRILDLGCGRGGVLIDFVKKGYRAVGIDVNKEYLDIARSKAKEEGLELELYHGVAENLPFQDGSFDFINCNEVTEHVENVENLMSECRRVLAPGGKMYVSFHNRFGVYDYHYHLWFINWLPRGLAEFIIRIIGKRKKQGCEAGKQKLSEMNYYTYANTKKLLNQYWSEIVDLREFQLDHASSGRRPIVKLLSQPVLKQVSLNLIKAFMSTFHFIVVK